MCLEDTLDGEVNEQDKILIEHTSNCISTHQGKHVMQFCEAKMKGKSLLLRLHGGLPAYASSMRVEITSDAKAKCYFTSSIKSPAQGLTWRITKKSVQLDRLTVKPGQRLHGWLSVELEERSIKDGKSTWKTYKIEGYFKPILQKVN